MIELPNKNIDLLQNKKPMNKNTIVTDLCI